jgi:hypothetical protein
VKVQFKFGETWQYEYNVNDVLRWGRNNVGVPGLAKVIADGVAEDCPSCGFREEWKFYIVIERDRITNVTPADGRYKFGSGETYVVAER